MHLHALNVYMHSMYTCTQCIHALNVYMHSMYTCTQCIHALNVYMHSMYTCTQCIHALNVYMHSMYTCTQCIHEKYTTIRIPASVVEKHFCFASVNRFYVAAAACLFQQLEPFLLLTEDDIAVVVDLLL